jgi:glycosyltransferase involved in cell wall biosynthesis
MKNTLTISANAQAKVGGQGLNFYHMVEALRDCFEVSVFCPAPYPDQNIPTTLVPTSRLSRAIREIPILRRRRDWVASTADIFFDHYVAPRVPKTDFFQGVTGQCTRSLATAKARGCFTILDVITPHMEEFHSCQKRECAVFGIRPPSDEQTVRRAMKEYQQADLIRVMSEDAKQTFLERGFSRDRLMVVPPPLDLDEFSPADFRGPKFRISFVGLIEPWKGFQYLIETFQSIQLRDAELVLWGGSGSRPIAKYLRESMAKNPAIVVQPVEVRSYGYENVYSKSSVLVHPSLCDGFAYVVVEAMASGIPVITTHNTGASQFVVDGVNGYLVDPKDRDMLADRLVHLARNPALVREMGAAARKAVQGMTLDGVRQLYLDRLELAPARAFTGARS